MIRKRPPLIGTSPAFQANNVERVTDELMREPTVTELEVESGANRIAHNLRRLPRGRQIIYQDVEILDTELTKTHWSFTASAAGTIKIIWVL